MSNLTILELNHDFWDRIQKDPEAFASEIVEYLRGTTHESADRLRRFGARPIATIHHTSEVNISFRHSR